MELMINFAGFRKIILFLGDLLLLYLSLIITLIIGFGQKLSLEILWQHLRPFSLLFCIWLFVFLFFDFYELNVPKLTSSLVTRIAVGLLTCLMIGVIFFYLLFPVFGLTPKTNLLIFIIILWGLLMLWRKTALYLFSSYFQNRVAIVGATKESEMLALILKRNPQLGYKLIEIIPIQNIANLAQKIQESKLNTLILAKELSPQPMFEPELYKYLSLKINFLDLPRAYEIILKRIPIGFVNQAWFLENLREGQKRFYDKPKRIFDIALALIFLILSLPFWVIIPLLIKIEGGGSVFYIQKRMGKNLNQIKIFKFRTMKEGADNLGNSWSRGKQDPRITKVGKFLRYLNLDEIPQMFNILKGELSFVGPRPENLENIKFLEKEIPYYHLRHLIKPGFTGWAQVNSAYESSMGYIADITEKIRYDFEKVEYDLYYIKNRSFVLDLNILFKSLNLFLNKEQLK
jgi:exopolysaccharide biosynthesis polyprenyl glycosylphosphotransferase